MLPAAAGLCRLRWKAAAKSTPLCPRRQLTSSIGPRRRLHGFDEVVFVLDATRAAHVSGVGTYGSGFISDPAEVRAKILRCGCSLASFKDLVAPGTLATVAHLRRGSTDAGFPCTLGPLALELTPMRVAVAEDGAGGSTYSIDIPGQSPLAAAGLGSAGRCSPRSALPDEWPQVM